MLLDEAAVNTGTQVVLLNMPNTYRSPGAPPSLPVETRLELDGVLPSLLTSNRLRLACLLDRSELYDVGLGGSGSQRCSTVSTNRLVSAKIRCGSRAKATDFEVRPDTIYAKTTQLAMRRRTPSHIRPLPTSGRPATPNPPMSDTQA